MDFTDKGQEEGKRLGGETWAGQEGLRSAGGKVCFFSGKDEEESAIQEPSEGGHRRLVYVWLRAIYVKN